MKTEAIDRALTLLDRTCDYAAIDPARAELDALKAELTRLRALLASGQYGVKA